MIRIFFFAFILSCASVPKKSPPPGAFVLTKTHTTEKDARNSIRNKWNYIFLLFEQSHDPYYGTPKWSPECLKNNSLGKIKETNGNVFFLSRLILNDSKEPGHCVGTDTTVIFLHCARELKTYEIHCSPGTCEKSFEINPCPLNP